MAEDRVAALSRKDAQNIALGRVNLVVAEEQARTALLEESVRHVVRYGRLGKQSERRLRAALRALEVSRG